MNHGLSPKPTPDPAIVAAVTAAVEALVAPTSSPVAPARDSTAWRFSGRWFATPFAR